MRTKVDEEGVVDMDANIGRGEEERMKNNNNIIINNNNNNNDDDDDGDDDQVEITVMEMVHKVELPQPKSTIAKLKIRFKETFFPNDPFRNFSAQPFFSKLSFAAKFLFPILSWAPSYSFSLFKCDLISGLTIASLGIPQGISYAKLANMPPIVGLYSSFVPPLVYAALGSSRGLVVGPVSISSMVMGSTLRQAVNPNTDPYLYLQLAFTSTLIAGIFQLSLGIFRLGLIIDFLSKPTLTGFMAGAAIVVSLQQLKNLLGIVHFAKKMGLVPVLDSVFHTTNEWSWQTIVMGIGFLGMLLLARHVSMKKPKLFWVSAWAPLAAVIISTLLVFLLKAQNHGISTIGHLPEGLNPPSWDKLTFKSSYLGAIMRTGLITGIVSLTEGVAAGKTFASLKGYKVDGNKEMMAIGMMNIIGSCTSCYITTGAFSRTAVNHNAGCKTAMSNIVSALTVMVTLLFLMPFFAHTPNVVLGAIIVTAVIGVIDVPAMYYIWKMDKMDFLVMLAAFLGVVFLSVQEGLAIAIGISIFRVLLQITRPKIVSLGNISGSDIYRNFQQYRDAKRVPGFLILAIEAPINFANTNYLHERIERWIEDEIDLGGKCSCLHFVILDLSGVSAVDTSGISFMIDLKKILSKKNIQLVFVNPVGEVTEKMKRANDALQFLGVNSLYLTVGEAVKSLSSLA